MSSGTGRMSEAEVVELLEGKSLALAGRRPGIAFDTNAIFSNRPEGNLSNELINTINQANERRATAPRIAMVVPAIVLHEKIRQMRQSFGEKFDITQPLGFLRSKNLVVKGFGASHAIATAARVQRIHPRDDDWRAFKKRRCLECLGLPVSTPTSGDGHRCGAPVDWLIAGHAEAKGYLLVTEDTGPELRGLSLSATVSVTLAAAKQVLLARNARDSRPPQGAARAPRG